MLVLESYINMQKKDKAMSNNNVEGMPYVWKAKKNVKISNDYRKNVPRIAKQNKSTCQTKCFL